MFKGIPGDQFHHFIASPIPQLPLSFHGSFPTFDPYYQQHLPFHGAKPHDDKIENFEVVERERMLMPEREDPWSGDEVLALLRIRSSMENWFPDFVWEHVSRKLAEIGYRRSPEKCKDKFEEESGYFSNAYSRVSFEGDDNGRREDDHAGENTEDNKKPGKRKRSSSSRKKFEMFKGFCEGVVQKILTQQEEMHAKLLEDMVKRDQEKAAREEEWKRREMDRFDKELELRANEQALARNRQDTILKFLNMFTSSSSSVFDSNPNFSSPALANPNSSNDNDFSVTKSNPSADLQYETSAARIRGQKRGVSKHEREDDLGKRWPRDEVLALINLRCSLFSSNEQEKEGVKAPVWERISQGMVDLGYSRSAKRCKEKWENINKYFRKTKDVNKKRPLDSRTCPYFHQLNAWYSQLSQGPGSRQDSPLA